MPEKTVTRVSQEKLCKWKEMSFRFMLKDCSLLITEQTRSHFSKLWHKIIPEVRTSEITQSMIGDKGLNRLKCKVLNTFICQG